MQIVNKDERNKWGSPRGYRIEPVGIINQVFGADWSMMPGLCKWHAHKTASCFALSQAKKQMLCRLPDQAVGLVT